MSQTHNLRLPLSLEDVRALRAGDFVHLTGDMVTAGGIPTHQRLLAMIDRGEPPPIDLRNGTLFNVPSYSRPTDDGYEVLYINPTTSTRFNDYVPTLIRHFGLRAVGGKGGLDQRSVAAMQETGCVYLCFPGGGSPLLSAAVKGVGAVHWDDLIFQYRLVQLQVENLGPLTVGIDAHGNSLFDSLKESAEARLPEILAAMRAERGAT